MDTAEEQITETEDLIEEFFQKASVMILIERGEMIKATSHKLLC